MVKPTMYGKSINKPRLLYHYAGRGHCKVKLKKIWKIQGIYFGQNWLKTGDLRTFTSSKSHNLWSHCVGVTGPKLFPTIGNICVVSSHLIKNSTGRRSILVNERYYTRSIGIDSASNTRTHTRSQTTLMCKDELKTDYLQLGKVVKCFIHVWSAIGIPTSNTKTRSDSIGWYGVTYRGHLLKQTSSQAGRVCHDRNVTSCYGSASP